VAYGGTLVLTLNGITTSLNNAYDASFGAYVGLKVVQGALSTCIAGGGSWTLTNGGTFGAGYGHPGATDLHSLTANVKQQLTSSAPSIATVVSSVLVLFKAALRNFPDV
jgi:hypothetical protein